MLGKNKERADMYWKQIQFKKYYIKYNTIVYIFGVNIYL